MIFPSSTLPPENEYVVNKRTTIRINDPDAVFAVEEGNIELYRTLMSNGEAVETRSFLSLFSPGELFFAHLPDREEGSVLFIEALPGTRLIQWRWTDLLKRLEEETETVRQRLWGKLEDWMRHMARMMIDASPPTPISKVNEEEEHVIWMESDWQAEAGVRWVCSEKKPVFYAGRDDIGSVEAGTWVPVMPEVWLHSPADNRLRVATSEQLWEQHRLETAMAWFQEQLTDFGTQKRRRHLREQQQRLALRERQDESLFHEAIQHFSAVADKNKRERLWRDKEESSPLLLCCQWVAEEMGIEWDPPSTFSPSDDDAERLLQQSGIRYRQVALRDGWWREDNGPLLAFWKDGNPVALLPQKGGTSYTFRDAEQSGTVRGIVARQFKPFAYELYRSFSPEPLSLRSLVTFAWTKNNQKEGRKALAFGLLLGVLGLAFPWLTGVLIDRFIPVQEQGLIVHMFILLFVIATALFGLTVVQSVAVLRIFGSADASLNGAVWDRLLKLPLPFFRRYDTGDLAVRLSGLRQMFQTASTALTTGMSTALFSVVQISLLFFISSSLAGLSAALIVLYVLLFFLIARRLYRFTKKEVEQQGKVNGLTVQLLKGMPKLRTAFAERRAFQRWSYEYSLQRGYAYQLREWHNRITVINRAYPILANLLLFGMLAGNGVSMSTGQFVTFQAVFITVITSVISFCQSCLPLLESVPQYKRLKPLIQERPEIGTAQGNPGELKGDIEVQRLSFSYQKDSGEKTLDDVSFRIPAGEFVAVVGPSGSGKSTLLRLLIGFEEPLYGSILYDGKDLSELDMQTVRKQCGVVLQNGSIWKGSITENIIGHNRSLTEEDAWRAVEAVGLAEDISRMPMKMHTMLSENGGTLSGGQRQRIYIARSIVHRPKMLFLDEATSALDQISQDKVKKTLETYQGTRLVIAHRLSTIEQADRIIVLNKGRVVQQGTYEELMQDEDQPFARLARRQVL